MPGSAVPAGEAEAIPAATVLGVRPGRGGLEVLMVRRPLRGLFAGVWVFPGGTVDPGDHAGKGTLAGDPFRRAAVRELFEEVGIAVEADALAFVSRWVTPASLPRRYDTRFYVVRLDASASVRLATSELEEAAFITPAAALGAHDAQQWPMVLPTVAHLRWLARFETMDAAIEATGRASLDPVSPMVTADGVPVPVDLPW